MYDGWMKDQQHAGVMHPKKQSGVTVSITKWIISMRSGLFSNNSTSYCLPSIIYPSHLSNLQF